MNDNMEQFLEGYEKVDSKPKVMKTDPMWEPNREMTPRTARAFWLEQEVVALQGSLARLSEGTSLKSSAYWAKGFHPPTGPPVRLSNSTEAGAGAAEHLLQARAGIVSSQKEGGGHSLGRCGEHLGQARASKRGFEHLGQDRACAANFEHLGEDHGHSLGGSGDQRGRARASALDLEHPGECPGDLLGGSGAHQRQDRAGTFGMGSYKECHGPEGPHQARALHGHGTSTLEGLRDNGPGSFTDLPRHGVGGGGIGEGSDRVYGPWSEGGSMNTKTELPDLPATSSPLQFGDWLHLSTPSMKDISGVAGWWWESTLREAKCYYEQWKTSSPLQRIQIRPQLPESLSEHRFQRTEQRGVQMLLKAIPLAEQQELVTDRSLSSTAILYKLMVRFQPGGAGEKQILLQQLTNMEKSSTIQEVAAAIRNWRRHFGRAEEVQAVLPDGILLLKALDEPLQKIASLDQQAAFRLSQSRMQLQLDQQPTQRSLWAFSQCLLAEAETLVLLQSSTSSTTSTPLKLKQLEGEKKSPTKVAAGDPKSTTSATVDKPCRYFVSDKGCKAGKSCKWQHDWESLTDKGARCFVCGSKEHRKNDCKLRSKKPGEPTGSRGGTGQGRGGENATSSTTTSTSTTGGTAGAAAVKVAKGGDDTSSTTTAEGGGAQPEVTSSTTNVEKDGSRGGGSESSSKGSKTEELLQEATQLLRTLRVPTTPKLKVMQIGGLDQVDANMVLIDSGATHGLRPARDADEWNNGVQTTVQLANGSTEAFRLKRGTKILLQNPEDAAAWIVPMGGLTDLGFTMQWAGNQCQLRDDEDRQVEVRVIQGCPMVSLMDGQRILEWLELYQVHQQRKLAMVRSLLVDEDAVDKSRMDTELALTYKLRRLFPDLPDDVMMRVVPHLEMVKTENFEARLPWNRHKRRRLRRAKHLVIHLFSGPDQAYWDRSCATSTTEVLCVDVTSNTPANLHDRNVYGYLLALCASGRVRAILGGPPCRTVSALRYQDDEGPGVLRADEYPYGLPTLSPADSELVLGTPH